MIRAAFILALSISPFVASAQTPAPAPPETPEIFAWERRLSAPKEGVILPDFSGTTMDGSVFTRQRLMQHVSLVVFWYPSCNCIDPKTVAAFTEFLSNPRFQIVSIMPDSFNYTAFIREKPVPGIHVNLASHQKNEELSMGGPYPAAMLVDGNGKIIKASNGFSRGRYPEQEWKARIREALMF